MWLSELRIEEEEEPKQKVLKPGSEYTVGRGERHHFHIDSKKVAKDYCSVKIGAFSDDDVGNPETRPPVQVINIRDKDKAIAVCKRGEQGTFYVGAGDVVEWEDGWIVQMAKTIGLEIKWERSCFFMPSPKGGTAPVEACAKSGIHLVHVLHKEVTHHITSTYNATVPLAISLVNQCKLVRSEYLTECVRLAENSEVKTVWPNLSKYRPTFAAGLESRHKRFEVWEPSEGRKHIFSELRFLCAGERHREIDSHMRLLLERGEGAIETFDVRDPARGMKWHRALSRGQAKEGKTLIVLGEQESITAAIGEDGWKELSDEAQGFGLVFRSIKDIVLAVLDNDTKALTARCESSQKPRDVEMTPVESPLPDVVPNTIPEELTIPPTQAATEETPARKKLPQRRVIRQPSATPESRPESQAAEPKPPEPKPTETKSDEPDAEAPRPRRVLTRRVHTGAAAANKSTSNVGPDAEPASATPAESSVPPVIDYSAPGRQPSSRLKRRVGTTDFGSREASAAPEDSAQEPVSKKYKSLFEESDPTKDQTTSLSEMMSSAFSQTQTMSGANGSRTRANAAAAQTLVVVPEEAETTTVMSQSQTQTTDGGRKRKARSVDYEDEEMAGIEEALAHPPSNSESRMSSVGPPSKKKAIENVNAVQPSQSKPPPSSTQTQKNTGAAPGKPDTDDAFLKAVASTKRGKRHEDDFDREFNKLKISKPDLNDSRDEVIEEEQRQWAILEDFGDDSNIRGNFMMIIELDVDASRRSNRERQREKENSEWEGKPNFKKFRKKNKPSSAVSRSHPVEVVLNEQSGYGMGTEYWRGSQTQTQKTDAGEITMAQSSNSQQPVVVIDSEEEQEEEAPKRGGRGKSKASARAGSLGRTTTSGKKKQQALFLDSDEEMSQVKEEEEELEQPPVRTLESVPPATATKSRGTRGRSKKQPVIVDDDSDEDVFKGFKGKGRRR